MQITVNGIRINYEKSGEGYPLILLHGNGESLEIFDKLIPKLSEKYTVYAIDSRNHGKSQQCLPLHYDDMAEDVRAFIEEMKLEKPYLYGFSDGGIIGLIVAKNYPSILGKLCVSGANVTPEGLLATELYQMKMTYFFTRSQLQLLMLTEPHITAEELGKISVPTLILVGSRDMIRPSHTRFIVDSIPLAKLQIFENETHSGYVVHSDKLLSTFFAFFKEE